MTLLGVMPTTSRSSRVNCSSARMTAGSSSSTWGLGACNLKSSDRTQWNDSGIAKCIEMHFLLSFFWKCINIRISQAKSSCNIRSPKDAGTPSLASASYPARLVESGIKMSQVWPRIHSYDWKQHLVHALTLTDIWYTLIDIHEYDVTWYRLLL